MKLSLIPLAPFFVTSLLGATVTLGCASPSSTPNTATTKPAEEKAGALAGAPRWVTGDCRDFFEGKPVVCGVGAVSGVASPSLARNAAMGRGRTEIARFLKTEVVSVLHDYQATKDGKPTQTIEEESEQITAMSLSGSKMASYFIAPDGTYYALMVLGYEDFTTSLESATTIEPPLVEALRSGCKRAFSSRDDEARKY